MDLCQGLHGLRDAGFASAPARFGDRGARCFVGRFMLRLDEAAACFWGIDDSGLKSLQERYGRNVYAARLEVDRSLFEARPALNLPCQDKGMSSSATRGYSS